MVAVRCGLLITLALTFQVAVAPDLRILGVQGDIMLLLALGAGLATGPDRGASIAFACGIAYDLLLQTPFGLSALSYALVAYLVGSLQDSVLRAAWWIPMAAAAAGSAVGVILYGVLGTVLGMDLLALSLVRIALVVGTLNAVIAAPVIRSVRWATGTQSSVRARAVYR
jgi:rod shape-determining protein MreD